MFDDFAVVQATMNKSNTHHKRLLNPWAGVAEALEDANDLGFSPGKLAPVVGNEEVHDAVVRYFLSGDSTLISSVQTFTCIESVYWPHDF